MPDMTLVEIDCGRIHDWGAFHDVFAETFGFPSFYGRNMDAWIDCMTYLDDPGAGMTAVSVEPGTILILQLGAVEDFVARCPELYTALVDGAAFVNRRRVEQGRSAVIALSYWKRTE